MSYWKKVCLGLVVFAAMTLASSSQTFTTIGYFPFDVETFSSLIQGRDGNFYVTAVNAYGFVYKVTPSGVTTDLYSFCQQAGCADGTYPRGNLALGIDGNLYGTTVNGGTHGKGTVFKITPDGAYTVLHSFNSWDGSNPGAGLVLGSDGNFYGNTAVGGAIASCSCGTVFKISSTGKLTTLHSLTKPMAITRIHRWCKDPTAASTVRQILEGGLPTARTAWGPCLNSRSRVNSSPSTVSSPPQRGSTLRPRWCRALTGRSMEPHTAGG